MGPCSDEDSYATKFASRAVMDATAPRLHAGPEKSSYRVQNTIKIMFSIRKGTCFFLLKQS